jgi:sugar phosphate permease
MDFLTIVFAFVIGAIVFGLMLLLTMLVERTAPEAAVRSVSGSARQNV